MAKIDEETILVKFSQLIRDEGNVTDSTILTEALRSNIEIAATNILLAEEFPNFVLVEATITTANV
jgi:hypothetical protein